MKCRNCNKEINKDEKFCKYCGKQVTEEKNNTQNITAVNPNFKRNNSHPWLIAGVFVAILVIGFIGLVTIAIIGDVNEEDSDQTTTKIIDDLITEEFKDKREKEEDKVIDFKGYTFTAPSNIRTSVSGEQLFIYGEKNEWVAVVLTQAGEYNTLVEVQDQLKTLIENQDSSYDVSSSTVEVKRYNNKEYLTISNIKKNGYLCEVAYGKADDNNLFIVSITRSDGTELKESDREKVYNIISTGVRGL